MDRRGFLGAILAAGAAPAIVRIGSLMPVQSIIVPTTRQVVDVLYGNRLLTIEQITREALIILENQLTFTTRVNDAWGFPYRVGDLIRVES